MSFSTVIYRLAVFHRRHGFWATVKRTGLAVRRSLISHQTVLFYCDLQGKVLQPASLPNSVEVQQKRSYSELTSRDRQEIINVWSPKLAERNINARFARGALLWLISVDNRLAGYGWSLQGGTIEPYYFPLGEDDVHLFDFYVFPQYRGRALNPALVATILHYLKVDQRRRVFIEAAEWNQPQLSSLGKTGFQCLGIATKLTIRKRTVVLWSEGRLRSGQPHVPSSESEVHSDMFSTLNMTGPTTVIRRSDVKSS